MENIFVSQRFSQVLRQEFTTAGIYQYFKTSFNIFYCQTTTNYNRVIKYVGKPIGRVKVNKMVAEKAS